MSLLLRTLEEMEVGRLGLGVGPRRRSTLAELFHGTGILDVLAMDATQVGLPAEAI